MMEDIQKQIKQTKPFRSREEAAYISLQLTAEKLKSEFNALFKTKGLTGAQYNALRILRGASANDGLSCSEVGERMINRDSDVTRMLDRLEKRGLITRERQSDDRRVVMTEITEEGRKILSELDGTVDKLQKELLGHLSEKDLNSFIDLLAKARQPSG